MHGKATFSRKSGPIVGAIVGAVFGGQAVLKHNMPAIPTVLVGLVIGGLAGCLVWFVDPARPAAVSDPLLAHFDSVEVVCPSGVIGRFLAIAGLVLCWTPFLGFVLNAIGLCVNWRSDDWARKVSVIGLVMGGLVAAVVGIGLALGL